MYVFKLESKTEEVSLIPILDTAKVSPLKYQPLAHICWTATPIYTLQVEQIKRKHILIAIKRGERESEGGRG